MPSRTVPGGIAALLGQTDVDGPILLLKWILPSGTQFFSSEQTVSWGGGTYLGNRIRNVSSFESGTLDGENHNYSQINIEFDNLADTDSSSFPFHALDAAQVLEDRLAILYAYSPQANDAVELWRGYSLRPDFSGSDKTVKISFSPLWDVIDTLYPNEDLSGTGFQAIGTVQNKDNLQDNALPAVYGINNGAKNFKIRPTIVASWTDATHFHVNAVVSRCADGFTFNPTDITSAQTLLFETTSADLLVFLTGSNSQGIQANISQFPDGAAHPRVAYFYAAFPITPENKNNLDNVSQDSIKMVIQNGAPLLDTGIPSQNHALIIKDMMRDAFFSLGLSNAEFDSTAVQNCANYLGTRYQAFFEFHDQQPMIDVLQGLLADCSCYMSNINGLYRIDPYRNDETPSVTFATSDSGHGGRKIHNDWIDSVKEEDFSRITNQVRINYRNWARHPQEVIIFDPNAQNYSGHGGPRVVEYQRESLSLRDELQAQIIASIQLRKLLNGDLFITFQTPFWDGIDVAPGQVISVFAPDIWNNGVNNVFRVIKQTFMFGMEPTIEFQCVVYNQAFFADSVGPLGTDVLRGGTNTSTLGRPPDVVPVSVTLKDVTTNDTTGTLATATCIWSYPTVNLAAEQADGLFREYPIAFVQLWGHYQDESINSLRLLNEVKYPTTQADIQFDFHKNRVYEVFFVALSLSRGRAPWGLIPDLTKISYLTATLGTGAASAAVASGAPFSASNFVIIEKETAKLLSVAGNTLNFVLTGGVRQTFFDTVAIAHPTGTQVAVAKQSYPSLLLNLNPPRFTYPIVGSFRMIQNPTGVRAKWDDVSADNVEVYHLYWSVDSDAGSNPAKLGSANPSWYTTDPENPPAGINLERTGQIHFDIDQTQIGPLSTIAYGRVAAQNGKRNYSSALSVLGNNTGTGKGFAPGMAPDPPSLSLITNDPVTDLNNKAVEVAFGPIFANGADHTKSFNDAASENLLLEFYRQGADVTKPMKYPFPIKDGTVLSLTPKIQMAVGDALTWIRNANTNGSGKNFSADNPINFVVGGFTLDPSTLFNWSMSITGDDAHHSDVSLRMQQQAPGGGHVPVLLKMIRLSMTIPISQGGDGNSKLAVPNMHLGNDITWSQLSADKTIVLKIKHPVACQGMTVTAELIAHGGLIRTVTLILNSRGDATGDNSTANWIAGAGAALYTQAGITIQVNDKHIRIAWNKPQHLTGAVDAAPQSVTQYGLQMVSGDGTVWIQPDSPVPFATSSGILEALFGDNHFHHAFKQSDVPAAFVSSGFKVAIRAYNFVQGVFQPGPWTQLTPSATVQFGLLFTPGDSDVPSQPPAPTVIEHIGKITVTPTMPTSNFYDVMDWQVAMSNANSPPTDALNPAATGGATIFQMRPSPGGPVHFRKNGLPAANTLFFFARARNSSFPSTGGPGGAGFSVWSPAGTLAGGTQSIITYLAGSGPPTLPTVTDTLAAKGYSSVSNVNTNTPITPNTKEMMRVWLDSDNLIQIEFILPTDFNAFSLQGIRIEVWKATVGVLRYNPTIDPTLTTNYSFPAFAGSSAAIRCTLINMFRDPTLSPPASLGQSPATNYVLGPQSGSGATYDPGTNPPPSPDFQAFNSRPDPYSLVL